MREHPLFRQPHPVDMQTTVPVQTPEAWKSTVREEATPVVPLVKESAGGSFEAWEKKYKCGWIVYYASSSLIDSPEVEVFCSGLNVKTWHGAALWRQGNLFHFSFDVAPSQSNAAGQALLLNSIVYISRFADDRPIVRTPGGWRAGNIVPRPRSQVDALFDRPSFSPDWLGYYFSPAALQAGRSNDLPTFKAWYKAVRPYLLPGPDGRLTLDEEARALGVPPDDPGFVERAAAALEQGPSKEAAVRLLLRYAPEGLGAGASAAEWRNWWHANRDYLFFCDSGGGRWYLDPLAKKRGVPSAQLRGPARASAP